MSSRDEEFTRYDSADYLTSVEDAAAYLEAAVEEAGDDLASANAEVKAAICADVGRWPL